MRADSLSQTHDVLLPTITVESPKTPNFSGIIHDEESIVSQNPHHPVRPFEGDDIMQSSDSECPDTEGVKSLFLPNRLCPSPSNSYRKMTASDFDHRPAFTDEMMAVYYSDPWSYYDPNMIDPDRADEHIEREEEEILQIEDPPFGPISEEAEEEFAELHQSFSNTSITATTTTSDSQPPKLPVNRFLSRHLSLDDLKKKRRILYSSFSYAQLSELSASVYVPLHQLPKDIMTSSHYEDISPTRSGFHIDPVIEQGWGSLRRVKVNKSPEIFMDSVTQPLGIDLQAYAIANWGQVSPLDDESVRIIAGFEDEDDESIEDSEVENDEGEMILEEGEKPSLPQMRRCQNFENINKMIVAGSPLYPVLEEGSNGEGETVTESPALSDGQTVHRWGRRIQQQTSSSVSVPQLTPLTPYAEDRVLVKQEEQLWASLFVPSEQVVVESAKDVAAQLQELSCLDEEVVEQADSQLSPAIVDEEKIEQIQEEGSLIEVS
ncbi:unnamed protein product [Hymenolepis diminuta]|uniref:Protein aurora borealis n=1 Tax=Hymenolepis diminuta TaxID=6216 RepID=A0A0R3SVB0_HYMDI|nr:unnamed protein product [Hymenolepis diminuta]